jgi:DNA-binding NarL/FixJ family response regulator
MKILLIEDHPIVRAGCRRILAGHEVTEATTAAAALALAETTDPDIIVLDLNLPDQGGLDLLPRLLARDSSRRVIVFSMYEDPGFVRRALEQGASGYLTKSDDPESLAEAVLQVAAGEVYLGATAAKKLALSSLRAGPDPLAVCSRRERDVMGLLAGGLSLAEIADQLGVSYRTAASLVAQLRGKLGLPSTAALIKRAVELHARA